MADKGIPFDVPTRANLLQGQRLIDEQLREKAARDAKLSPLDKAYAALEAARTFGSGILATVGSLPTRAIKGEDAAQEYINQRMYIPTTEKGMDYVGNVGNFLEQLETKYKLPPVLPEAVALQNVMGPAAKQATKQAAKAAKPVVGQALEDYMFKQGLALPATVYHGSPHKFDKFDASKIGTGEGSQAYGHGLYLAESPEVARGYKDKLQGGVLGEKTTSFLESKLSKSNPELFTTAIKPQVLDTISANAGKSPAEMSSALNRLADSFERQGFDWQLAAAPNVRELAKNKQLLSDISQNVAGSLYKVDLPDEQIAKMLDWDKPLSQQAPALEALSKNKDFAQYVERIMERPLSELDGKTLQRMAIGYAADKGLGGASGAADVLRQAGIPGIRYLDGGSRGTGAGTSNFVVFPGEEDALTILERNQQPIKKESTRIADNPDTMMMEVEDQKFGIGGMAGKAVKSAVATRELEKQAVLRAEAAAKSAAKQALMPQYNEAVKGMTKKQDPLSFEEWKAINYPEGTQGLQNAPQKQTFKYPQESLPAEERDENLQKFLGNSRIRDRLYHATPKNFSEFKPGGDDPTISGPAIWLTPNATKQPAAHNISSRSQEFREGTNVMPVYAQARSPLLLDDKLAIEWAREVYADGSSEFPDLLSPKTIEELKKGGYDSIIHADPYGNRGGEQEIIMFEPNKIKSAIGNRGTYDINEADINKAVGGAVFNTDPDMSDGGQIIQGPPFKHGGDVNLDAMYMAVNDAKFRRK